MAFRIFRWLLDFFENLCKLPHSIPFSAEQHRSEVSGQMRKISLPPTGIRSPDLQACSESLHRLSYPEPSFLSELNENKIISTDFQKNIQISKCMKIRPVEAELFHADGQTDRQTGRNWQSLFAILRTHLKIHNRFLSVISFSFVIGSALHPILRYVSSDSESGTPLNI